LRAREKDERANSFQATYAAGVLVALAYSFRVDFESSYLLLL
jgi:hypothetical protein